jgi:hypothetical protein
MVNHKSSISSLSKMFEDSKHLTHQINPESLNPNHVARPGKKKTECSTFDIKPFYIILISNIIRLKLRDG